MQALVVKTVTFETTHFEILNHHIGFSYQLTDQLLPFRVRQINRKGLFISIGAQEIGRDLCINIIPLEIGRPS